MTMLVAPTPATTTPADTLRRAPSMLQVPSLDDASATASASLNQVASYVSMLHAALGEDPSFYARLVKRGFLEIAIEYTRYALEVVNFDHRVDQGDVEGMIEGAVLEALLAARNMGTPAITEPNLLSELQMAGAAATNAANGLQALVAAAC